MPSRISLHATLFPKARTENDNNGHSGENEISVGGFKDAVFYLVASEIDGTLTLAVKIQNYDETSKEWVDFFSFTNVTGEGGERIGKTITGRKVRIYYQRISGSGTIKISCGVDLKD